MSVISIDRHRSSVNKTLNLSASRTYDCALEMLGAYKLTDNFAVDLQIVLRELGIVGQVTFEIKPKRLLSDCRHVEFAPSGISTGRFNEIMRSIESRVGFDAASTRRVRLFA